MWNVGCFEGDISPSLSLAEETAAATASAIPKKRLKREDQPITALSSQL
jgi:hypothetical protein